jgi:hypothetical protein
MQRRVVCAGGGRGRALIEMMRPTMAALYRHSLQARRILFLVLFSLYIQKKKILKSERSTHRDS